MFDAIINNINNVKKRNCLKKLLEKKDIKVISEYIEKNPLEAMILLSTMRNNNKELNRLLLPVIAKLFDHPSSDIVMAAQYCAGMLFITPEGFEILPVLKKNLCSNDENIFIGAVSALGNIANSGYSHELSDIIPYLNELTEGDDKERAKSAEFVTNMIENTL